MIVVSACLTGKNCKYNGGNNLRPAVVKYLEGQSFHCVCPETAGNLPVPRPPCEYQGERIIDREGEDRTEAFLTGAKKSWEDALKEAELRGETITSAILKAKSPSCGCGKIYDGTFTGTLTDGDGCFVRLLKEQGIPVFTEEDIINQKENTNDRF